MPKPGFVFVEFYTQDIPYYVSLLSSVCGMRQVRDEGDFVELRSNYAVVLLNADTDSDLPEEHPFRGKTMSTEKGVGVEIGVVVADLEAAHLAAGSFKDCVLTALRRQSWGLSDFRITTPDGFYIRVTEAFE